MTQRELEDGTIVDFTPEEEVERLADILKDNRTNKKAIIKLYALQTIQAAIPALDTFEEIKLLEILWPMLDTSSPPTDIALVRNIYIYAKEKFEQAETATQVQLDAYDPTTDPNWPS